MNRMIFGELNRKLLVFMVILQPVILVLALRVENVVGQERFLKILSLDGSNSITLGNPDMPIPPGGIPFTIKVVLEGATSHLNTFQVGLKFDSSKLNCTGAWVPKNDPSFVFYGKRTYEAKDINNTYDPARPNSTYPYVMVFAALQQPGDYVDVSGGILALINFTAIGSGTTTIEFYPEPFQQQHMFTFLLNEWATDIPYTEGGSLTVTVLSSQINQFIFNVLWNGETYPVAVATNSTITDFNFSQPLKQISFNVTGSDGTTGFCLVIMPKVLLGGPYMVKINDEVILAWVDPPTNGTHTFLYFTYNHTTKNVKIIGTTIIPEFPIAILPLYLTLTLLAIILGKRKTIA